MAVPVHIWFYDDGGSLIKGSCDVQDREGSVEIRYYRINDAGWEVEYFRTELEGVKVVSISPIVNDTRNCPGTGHLESVQLRYEKATWTYCDGNIQFADAWNERASA